MIRDLEIYQDIKAGLDRIRQLGPGPNFCKPVVINRNKKLAKIFLLVIFN